MQEEWLQLQSVFFSYKLIEYKLGCSCVLVILNTVPCSTFKAVTRCLSTTVVLKL